MLGNLQNRTQLKELVRERLRIRRSLRNTSRFNSM